MRSYSWEQTRLRTPVKAASSVKKGLLLAWWRQKKKSPTATVHEEKGTRILVREAVILGR